MKKIQFIAAICLIMIAASAAATQAITPLQLKEARVAAYKWVRDYNVYARMEGRRNPTQNFIDLFEDESTQIFNDYLPFRTTYGEMVPIMTYASMLADRESVYQMAFEISNAEITSEKLGDSQTILFTIEFDKSISFHEKGNTADNRYAYPQKTFHVVVSVVYNTLEKKAFANGIQSTTSFENILVLHDEGSESINQYTYEAQLTTMCTEKETALIKWDYTPTDFDPQMVYLVSDTIRNSIHFGGGAGYNTYTTQLTNDNFDGYSIQGGVNYSFSIGYYRQLLLKDKNRLGIDFSLAFSQKDMGFSAKNYHEEYKTTDPDGGEYLRLIDLKAYQETIQRMAIAIPITIRYDYFVQNNLSFFSQAGVVFSYDVAQKASFSASAQYSGYYDWLLGVTITQNGIYDFGAFDIQGTSTETGINRFSLGVCAGAGIQYFIPKSKWSFEAMVLYDGEVYNKHRLIDNFHLTMSSQHWNSCSYLFTSFYGHNIQVQLNFKYNF